MNKRKRVVENFSEMNALSMAIVFIVLPIALFLLVFWLVHKITGGERLVFLTS